MPDHIGQYELLRPIGAGTMGQVFLAFDGQGRTVAVKVLHAHLIDDANMRRRLRGEVETMRRVQHERVAAVLDFDLDADPPYLVTRYAQGRSLTMAVTESGPLVGEALMRVMRGSAEALAAIHAAGVVHRDIKPANIMLEDGHPVIIDFGIAHAMDATRLTRHGQRSGTALYLAPELWEGADVEPPVDVFAWAATMGFAATGRHTFDAPHDLAVRKRVFEGEPDLDGIPDALRGLLAKALSSDPAQRPPAAELPARLLQALDLATVLAAPAPEPVRGEDVGRPVTIDLADVLTGTTLKMIVEHRTFFVELPAGVESGTRITLTGDGEPGRHGGPPGDMIVKVAVRDHPNFLRERDDLHCSLELPYDLALWGGELGVEVLDGELTIQIPPAITTGGVIKADGYGLPRPGGTGRGDLYLRAIVAPKPAEPAEPQGPSIPPVAYPVASNVPPLLAPASGPVAPSIAPSPVPQVTPAGSVGQPHVPRSQWIDYAERSVIVVIALLLVGLCSLPFIDGRRNLKDTSYRALAGKAPAEFKEDCVDCGKDESPGTTQLRYTLSDTQLSAKTEFKVTGGGTRYLHAQPRILKSGCGPAAQVWYGIALPGGGWSGTLGGGNQIDTIEYGRMGKPKSFTVEFTLSRTAVKPCQVEVALQDPYIHRLHPKLKFFTWDRHGK